MMRCVVIAYRVTDQRHILRRATKAVTAATTLPAQKSSPDDRAVEAKLAEVKATAGRQRLPQERRDEPSLG